MSACRSELDSDPPTPLSQGGCGLEDLYPLLEMTQGEGEEGEEEGDVYAMLAQKEKDLTLAAELGKALLEKNKELSMKNEQMAEEYSQSLEVLEQEKYELHLRLEQRETEFANTVKELQEDLASLREELRLTQQHCHQGDQERSHTIRDLVKQNEHLAEQARQSTCREEELEVEMQHLRGQVHSRRSTLHEHVTQLEMLKDELEEVQRQKSDQERKVHSLTEERKSLLCSLEESQDRIHMLERQCQEQEEQVYKREREIRELQEANSLLQARIDHLSSRQRSPDNYSGHSQTLFNELSHLSGLDAELQAAAEAEQPGLEAWQRSMSAEMLDEDDFECDDEGLELGAVAMSSPGGGEAPHFFFHAANTSSSALEGSFQEHQQLREDVGRACQMVRSLIAEMEGRDQDYSCHDEAPSTTSAGSKELLGLLADLQQRVQSVAASQGQSGRQQQQQQQRAARLEQQVEELEGRLGQAHSGVQDRNLLLQQRHAELLQLAARLERQQQEMRQLQQERDALQDKALGEVSLSQVLTQTRQERDQAQHRCQEMELELVQARAEMATLSEQLLGAIQQKVNISQELDQWQVDMEEVLDVQMQRRMDQEQAKEKVEAELLKTSDIKKSASTSSFFKSSQA